MRSANIKNASAEYWLPPLIAAIKDQSSPEDVKRSAPPTRRLPYCRMQAQTRLPRLPQSCGKGAKLKPENFWLHKFRATFATWSLWAGVDLRTVQQWLGHSDIESTMRYLKPSRSQQVRAKVNEIFH